MTTSNSNSNSNYNATATDSLLGITVHAFLDTVANHMFDIAADGTRDIDDLKHWKNIYVSVEKLYASAVDYCDDDFDNRIVDHLITMQSTLQHFDCEYPEACILSHMTDVIDWLSNLA